MKSTASHERSEKPLLFFARDSCQPSPTGPTCSQFMHAFASSWIVSIVLTHSVPSPPVVCSMLRGMGAFLRLKSSVNAFESAWSSRMIGQTAIVSSMSNRVVQTVRLSSGILLRTFRISLVCSLSPQAAVFGIHRKSPVSVRNASMRMPFIAKVGSCFFFSVLLNFHTQVEARKRLVEYAPEMSSSAYASATSCAVLVAS